MTQQMPFSNAKFNKSLSPDELETIFEAILDGKYSWACALLVRSVGYNPLEYIPYRTYKRLVKENTQVERGNQSKTVGINKASQSIATKSDKHSSQKHSSKIIDLGYIEPVSQEKNSQLRGGACQLYNCN